MSLSLEGFPGARAYPFPPTIRENRDAIWYILWVTLEKISIISPSKIFWTKDISDVDTVVVASSGVQESRDEKTLGICRRKVNSLEALSPERLVFLRGPSYGGRNGLHPDPSLLTPGMGCIFLHGQSGHKIHKWVDLRRRSRNLNS